MEKFRMLLIFKIKFFFEMPYKTSFGHEYGHKANTLYCWLIGNIDSILHATDSQLKETFIAWVKNISADCAANQISSSPPATD